MPASSTLSSIKFPRSTPTLENMWCQPDENYLLAHCFVGQIWPPVTEEPLLCPFIVPIQCRPCPSFPMLVPGHLSEATILGTPLT